MAEEILNDATTNEVSTFTQAQVDAIVRDRLAREKARYADYDDLKAQANKYAELEEASKSELQKALERAEKSDTRVAQLEKQIADAAEAAERKKLVDKIAKKYHVSSDLKRFMSGKTEEELIEEAEILGKPFSEPSKNEGKHPNISTTEDITAFVCDFFSDN